jgi:hypothetical protein
MFSLSAVVAVVARTLVKVVPVVVAITLETLPLTRVLH